MEELPIAHPSCSPSSIPSTTIYSTCCEPTPRHYSELTPHFIQAPSLFPNAPFLSWTPPPLTKASSLSAATCLHTFLWPVMVSDFPRFRWHEAWVSLSLGLVMFSLWLDRARGFWGGRAYVGSMAFPLDQLTEPCLLLDFCPVKLLLVPFPCCGLWNMPLIAATLKGRQGGLLFLSLQLPWNVLNHVLLCLHVLSWSKSTC